MRCGGGCVCVGRVRELCTRENRCGFCICEDGGLCLCVEGTVFVWDRVWVLYMCGEWGLCLCVKGTVFVWDRVLVLYMCGEGAVFV